METGAHPRRDDPNPPEREEHGMPHYLVQAAYTPEAWAALVATPQDRSDPVRSLVEEAGGALDAFYLAFGDFDVVAIVELPDDSTAAAVSITISASGAVKAMRTTPLLSTADALGAMTRARSVSYQAPSSDLPFQTPMHAG
jgi:uncharacterized protein with GYD domain